MLDLFLAWSDILERLISSMVSCHFLWWWYSICFLVDVFITSEIILYKYSRGKKKIKIYFWLLSLCGLALVLKNLLIYYTASIIPFIYIIFFHFTLIFFAIKVRSNGAYIIYSKIETFLPVLLVSILRAELTNLSFEWICVYKVWKQCAENANFPDFVSP